LQPTEQLRLPGLAQLRLRDQGQGATHDRQANQGKAIVGNFKETMGDIACECSQAAGQWF
jgi:hypothetical protein